MSTLTALLLNPATGGGGRTLQRVESAALILRMDDAQIVNLFPQATKDLRQLRLHAQDEAVWLEHRSELQRSINSASSILVGWGTSVPTGAARLLLKSQREWALGAIEAAGHSYVWTVGGKPRHPSRWHQRSGVPIDSPSGRPLSEILARALVRTHVQELRG